MGTEDLCCPPHSLCHPYCCRFTALLEDAAFALELAQLEDSNSSSELADMLSQARSALQQLAAALDTWELRMLLAGPYDEAGALLTITAGAGGRNLLGLASQLSSAAVHVNSCTCFSGAAQKASSRFFAM
jgi:hypothetical protein